MTKRILLLLILSVFVFKSNAQTTVPALITSNQVWTASGSPYLVNQNTYIDTGVSVTVMPGVEVKSTGSVSLMVAGEFRVLGKWDTMVKFRNVTVAYQANSKKYNPSTNRGAYINYADFNTSNTSQTSISSNSTSIKVSNSTFINYYWNIDVTSITQDTVNIWIIGNKFLGDQYKSGAPIHAMSSRMKMQINDNYFTNASTLYLEGQVTFKNNTLFKMYTASFYLHGINDISCNKFLRFNSNLSISLFSYTGKGKLSFNYNTLDSMGSFSTYPMMSINRNGSNSVPFGKTEFKYNNFFRQVGTVGKVGISGNNNTPTKTDTLDFTNNYWGSNDSTTIESYIRDYNDNINVYGRANIKNFSATPINSCSYNGNNCAIAKFSTYVTDSIVIFTDKSIGSKPYKVKWVFGDGKNDNSNSKIVTHLYSKPGFYTVCLYTYDTLENLCDSTCSTIEIVDKTKCGASYYFAVDTNDNKLVYIINNSKGINSRTKYYWTFGDGSGVSTTNPTHKYLNAGRYQLCLTIFDSTAGCYSTFCDSIVITENNTDLVVLNEDMVNIKNQNTLKSIIAYPNPSNGKITLLLDNKISENIKIQILNINGQVLETSNIEANLGVNEIDLNLSNYSNGLYFVKVSSGSSSKTIKLNISK